MLDPEEFFSLSTFMHQDLWEKDAPAWSALLNIEKYLELAIYKIEGVVSSQAHLENEEKISIGEGSVIDPGVMIEGPCIIGKRCKIRHGAYLRGGCILGDDCIVGHSAEVKHSILLDRACASHFCYVGDSILGSDVNLGAGVKCANLRLDRKEVSVFVDGKKILTGLKKFGALLGDGVQVGCNCVLNPGTCVGKESLIQPLLNLGGVIGAQRMVKQAATWSEEPLAEKILQRLLRE